MIIKVVFKNGNKEEFDIDNHYISDNGFCLILERDREKVGLVNLSEVRFFKIEEEEPETTVHYEGGSYEVR